MKVRRSLGDLPGAQALGEIVVDALVDCDKTGAFAELTAVIRRAWQQQKPDTELSPELERALKDAPLKVAEWEQLGAVTAIAIDQRIVDDTDNTSPSDHWLQLMTRCAPQTPLPLLPHLFEILQKKPQRRLAELCATRLRQPEVPRPERLALAALLRNCPIAVRDTAPGNVDNIEADPALQALITNATDAQPSSANIQLLGDGVQRVSRFRWLWAVSGLLLLGALVRAFRRYLLREKSKSTITLQRAGLEIVQADARFGQQEHVRNHLFPKARLASITLERRFAGVSTVAGLLCLALGTLIGVAWASDGLRVHGGSPSLLVAGMVAIVLGIALDFALTRLSGLRGDRCALLIRADRQEYRVSGVDPEQAGAFLRAAKEHY